MTDRLSIAAGDWALELSPVLGGSVTALRYRGGDVLRPAPADASHPLQASCFPMLPFVNRIAQGSFAFEGRSVTIPPNLAGDRHALHGLAWLEPWHIAETGPGSARLVWQCDGSGDWPWAHRAEQRFTLDRNGLRITLAVTSLSAERMPIGLGFHPYFPATSGTELRFTTRRVWLSDVTLLPVSPAPPDALGDWTGGAPLPRSHPIDNCYEDWNGAAEIAGERRLLLTAQGARDVHLYAPRDADFFCLEPCTQLPDAFNRGDRFDVLAPGECRSISVSLAFGDHAVAGSEIAA